MIKLTQLAGWKTLKAKEKKRLKEVYGIRVRAVASMLSKREMNRIEREKNG